MHVRNVFRTAPDFKELGELYPDLQSHLIQVRKDYYTINFKDPAALNILTCSLAAHYFDITLDIPSNRLIPTIPLRMNYLLWIEDLLSYRTTTDNVVGIDIGTGASSVYALLGWKNFGWRFLATETDETCFEAAVNNVLINSVHDKIIVKHVKSDGDKLLGNLGPDQQYTFCMCNPPFFEDTENMTGFARTLNRASPKSVCTATPVEVITVGGEEQFVGDMVTESLTLGTQVTWYTSMLGRKTSLDHILGRLAECGVARVATTEFKQGNTTRWGIAWSLEPSIPPLLTPTSRKVSTTYSFTTECSSPQKVITRLQASLAQLHVQEITCPGENTEYCTWLTACENTWSHSRRKRRKGGSKLPAKRICTVGSNSDQTLTKSVETLHNDSNNVNNVKTAEQAENPSSMSYRPCLFHCLLSVEKTENGVSVDLTWIFGSDKDSLNQLCCFLAKCISNSTKDPCG